MSVKTQHFTGTCISEASIRQICEVPEWLWAIHTGHGMVGILMFATRREARERLREVRATWPRARVLRVHVLITPSEVSSP